MMYEACTKLSERCRRWNLEAFVYYNMQKNLGVDNPALDLVANYCCTDFAKKYLNVRYLGEDYYLKYKSYRYLYVNDERITKDTLEKLREYVAANQIEFCDIDFDPVEFDISSRGFRDSIEHLHRTQDMTVQKLRRNPASLEEYLKSLRSYYDSSIYNELFKAYRLGIESAWNWVDNCAGVLISCLKQYGLDS